MTLIELMRSLDAASLDSQQCWLHFKVAVVAQSQSV